MAWTTPKTDWTTGELVSASDMNSIGANLAALKQKAVAAYSTTSDIRASLGGTGFHDVDGTNLSLTITTTGGDVLVYFRGCIARSDGQHREERVYLDVTVDGTRQGSDKGVLRFKVDGIEYNASFMHLVQNLSAGSHTFKLQWRSTRSAKLYRAAQFVVREI